MKGASNSTGNKSLSHPSYGITFKCRKEENTNLIPRNDFWIIVTFAYPSLRQIDRIDYCKCKLNYVKHN